MEEKNVDQESRESLKELVELLLKNTRSLAFRTIDESDISRQDPFYMSMQLLKNSFEHTYFEAMGILEEEIAKHWETKRKNI